MYRIWIQVFKNGEHVESMVSAKAYKRKGNAFVAARKMYQPHGDITYRYSVSTENPWRREND